MSTRKIPKFLLNDVEPPRKKKYLSPYNMDLLEALVADILDAAKKITPQNVSHHSGKIITQTRRIKAILEKK